MCNNSNTLCYDGLCRCFGSVNSLIRFLSGPKRIGFDRSDMCHKTPEILPETSMCYWIMALHDLVLRYQRFGQTYCIHLPVWSEVLIMETVSFSEPLSLYESTWRHNPAGKHWHLHLRENLKFYLKRVLIQSVFNKYWEHI